MRDEGPDQVDHAGGGVEAGAQKRGGGDVGVFEAVPGFAGDEEGSGEHEGAFDDGAEVFGLVVAVGVVGVGRQRAEPERDESADGGDDVDDGFQRVGIEGHAAGEPPGAGLHGEHDDADAQAAPGESQGGGHGALLHELCGGPERRPGGA